MTESHEAKGSRMLGNIGNELANELEGYKIRGQTMETTQLTTQPLTSIICSLSKCLIKHPRKWLGILDDRDGDGLKGILFLTNMVGQGFNDFCSQPQVEHCWRD